MPAGVIFRVGGALDPSYKTALAQSVAEAKAAQISINKTSVIGDSANSAVAISSVRARKEVDVLRKQQRDLKVLQASMIASSAMASKDKFAVADAIAKKEAEIEVIYAKDAALKVAQIRYDAGLALSVSQVKLMAESQAEQKVILAASTAEQVAIVRAGQMEEAEAFIAASAAENASGAGGHSTTGKIRESLVIMREIMMGRGGPRVAGSATLLAQYWGVLGLAVKSTATEQVVAYAASKKLTLEMYLQAVAAQKAAVTDVEKAAADKLMAAATDQAALSTKLLKEQQIALASAVVTANPIFFACVGILLLLGGAAFFIIRHFHNAAVAAKNLADALNPLKQKYTELAEAQDKAAKAGQEYADWTKELENRHRSESEQLERKIKLLKEEWAARKRVAEARGASDGELQALDMASLEAEKQMLLVEQARLDVEYKKAKAASDAASAAAIAGPTTTDEFGQTITYDQAKKNVETRGHITDAAEAAQNESTGYVADKLELLKKQHGGSAQVGDFLDQFTEGEKQSALTNGITKDSTLDQALAVLNNQVQDIVVDGHKYQISVADARKNFDSMNEKVRKLATDQAALDDVLKSAKSTAAEKMDAQNRVNEDLESVADEMKTAQESPATRRGGGANREVSERERIGVGAPQVANLQKQTLDVTRKQLTEAQKLNSKIDKLIASGNGASNPDGW
jgi:hypothetical protein